MTRDPIFDDKPAPETRAMGIATLVLGVIGSALIAWVMLDVGRYAHFVVVAHDWSHAVFVGHWPAHGRSSQTMAILLAATALAASFVLARTRRAPRVALAVAIVMSALALLTSGLQAVIVAQRVVRESHDLGVLGEPLFHLAGTGVVVPAMLALAAGSTLRSGPARLTIFVLVLPIVVASCFLGARGNFTSRNTAEQVDALVVAMHAARPWALLAMVPALALAGRMRARWPLVLAALGWLLVAALLLVLSRPLAADAEATAPDLALPEGCSAVMASYGPILHFPGPTLDGRLFASPEALGGDLDTLRRNWSIVHPRDPYPGSFTLDATVMPSADELRPWLAEALAEEHHQLVPRWSIEREWSTRSMGTIESTLECRRWVELTEEPMDPAFDPATLFAPGPDLTLGVGTPVR